MSTDYTKINLNEVEDAAPGHGFDERWEARIARRALGGEETGLSLFRLRPGKRSPFAHRHREAEEIYVILRGSGRVKLGEEVEPVSELDAIRVAPRVPRAFEAGPEGLEFLAFGLRREDGEPVADPWVG